jgi:hypothetical protein
MANMRALAALLLLAAAPLHAAPLTVKTGETWVFVLKEGQQPANAHKVAHSAKAGKGQIIVSVRALLGTTMIVTNNSPVAYTFRAELLQGGKAIAARPCTLPANGKPIFEQWKEKADAVRLSAFKRASADGLC